MIRADINLADSDVQKKAGLLSACTARKRSYFARQSQKAIEQQIILVCQEIHAAGEANSGLRNKKLLRHKSTSQLEQRVLKMFTIWAYI
jgi:hypothetical protein